MTRFWSKVNKAGPVGTHRPDLGPCWVWEAGKCGGGYGVFMLNQKCWRSHILAYRWLVSEVPPPLVLDHLCRNRACVNPSHLEPKTRRDNALAPGSLIFENGVHERAKTCCPRGHEYSPSNTRVFRGSRYCRECTKAYDRRRNTARRERSKHEPC